MYLEIYTETWCDICRSAHFLVCRRWSHIPELSSYIDTEIPWHKHIPFIHIWPYILPSIFSALSGWVVEKSHQSFVPWTNTHPPTRPLSRSGQDPFSFNPKSMQRIIQKDINRILCATSVQVCMWNALKHSDSSMRWGWNAIKLPGSSEGGWG